ncbi:MAG TPA: glycerol-3-phosphate 1-O-acyltransferase PlsY [Tepidisphaeraceae bacterium]|jgi:glycerol-3-phosphate acyltransferase PlsY|nr:glycerol-3-phosphate 1-O-acyltransferase PlsY [Tepidisphaeraceae bacterium]
MDSDQTLLILIPLAYLIGSIPFGLIVGKAKGIDPRTSGSGNIGATNLGRLLGGKYFALVFSLDLLKGAIPTLAAGLTIGFHVNDRQTCLLWIAVAAAAVLGHVFSLFLKFKGGKGVATSAGVVLGIYPYFTLAGVIAMIIFVIVFRITRYISVSSILAAVSFPAAYAVIGFRRWSITEAQLPLLCFAIVVPLLILYKHRGNIARLRAGTEPRFNPKSKATCASK